MSARQEAQRRRRLRALSASLVLTSSAGALAAVLRPELAGDGSLILCALAGAGIAALVVLRPR